MANKKNHKKKCSQLKFKKLKLMNLSGTRDIPNFPEYEFVEPPVEQPASQMEVTAEVQDPVQLEPVQDVADQSEDINMESTEEFVEYCKKRHPSSTWNYFLTSSDRQSAKCKICSRVIKTSGSSTSGLHGHLRSRHKIKLEFSKKCSGEASSRVHSEEHTTLDTDLVIVKQEPITAEISFESEVQNDESIDDEPIAKKIKQGDDHSESESMKLLIARMAALDGISLSNFCTSLDLRCLFANVGFELPTSVAEVINILTAKGDIIKAELEEKFECYKYENYKFCLSFQQYQTSRNQFYFSINIHNKNQNFGGPKNLGLFKVTMPIEFDEFLKKVSAYLSEYNITLNGDITAFTCDDSLTTNGVDFSIVNQTQLCLAQAVQHAVVNRLYRKELIPDNLVYINSDESDEDSTDEIDMTDPFLISEPISINPQLIYRDTIDKVRKLVRYFKNSTSRNAYLQNLVRKKYGKEIHLLMDCKKRWTSMCEMIGRFLKLKELVQKSMQYFEVDLFINDEELRLLTETHDSLVVIKATITALCKPNANLLTADAALRFMLRKLDEQKNNTSQNFALKLREYIKERRSKMSSILQYLHDRYSYNNYEDHDTFVKPSSDEMVDIIVSLLKRLKQEKDTEQAEGIPNRKEANEKSFDDPLGAEDDEELSIEKQLEKEINNTCHDKLPSKKLKSQQLDLKSIVMGEISIYESFGGSRGMYLTTAYEYLLSVVPAIAEAEQYFYASKHAYKTLSNHPDKILNTLFFLRSYFIDQKSEQ
ncbi:unnamed protein product [Colias eurytheme]|nr:unnamed protein product [Colias eurytheme]